MSSFTHTSLWKEKDMMSNDFANDFIKIKVYLSQKYYRLRISVSVKSKYHSINRKLVPQFLRLQNVYASFYIWERYMTMSHVTNSLRHMTKMALLSELNLLCFAPRVDQLENTDYQLENEWLYFLLSTSSWKIISR